MISGGFGIQDISLNMYSTYFKLLGHIQNMHLEGTLSQNCDIFSSFIFIFCMTPKNHRCLPMVKFIGFFYHVITQFRITSEISQFCMTTILATSCHDEMTTEGCQMCDRVVRRLLTGCQRGVIGAFISHD